MCAPTAADMIAGNLAAQPEYSTTVRLSLGGTYHSGIRFNLTASSRPPRGQLLDQSPEPRDC